MKKLITYLLCATLATGSIYAFTQKVLPGSERELATKAMTKAGRNAAVQNESAGNVSERVLTKVQQQALNDLKAKSTNFRKGSPVAVKPKMVLQSVQPFADNENAKITLNVLMDWGDGSGYQVLLDSDHSAYGLNFMPGYGIEPETYTEYEYKLPADASGDFESGSWVNSGETQSIEIPAGTYDYVVTNPSITDSGLTIYIASGEDAYGDDFTFAAGAEYIFTLSQNGNYDLCTLDITAPIDLSVTGISSPISGTGLSSEDVTVTIANNGSNAVSSFKVAMSVDGGTAVEESVQQTINPGASLDYTLTNKADLSAAGVHTVTVSVIADNDANAANNSFSAIVANGTPVDPPYTCDFETEEDFAEWIVIDNNGDNDSWEYDNTFYGSGVALIGYNATDYLDDYLITVNPINLDAGENNITFEYRALSASYFESFEVLYGKTPNVEDMTVIRKYENFNENTENVFSPITFTAEEAGAYYFAFHATSMPDQMGMYIDNVTIDKGAYIGTPDISIDQVILPTSATTLGTGETIGAVVSNVGTDDITSFSLMYKVNDSSAGVSENFSTPIPMGESVTVEFLTPADFSQEGTYTVSVTATSVESQSGHEDSNADNNTASATTTHFAPADVPFITDFTNEEDRTKWAYESGSWIYDTNYEAMNALMGKPLISQGINLESGKSYRMSFNYMAGMVMLIWQLTDDFDIVCGLDGTPIEEWEVIASYEDVYTNDTFVTNEAMFECDESGIYSFAIVPKTNNATIYVKSVSITEMSDYDIAIASISGMPSLIPESQAKNINMSVNLENRGLKAIEQGNIIVTFNGTSSVAGMASIPQIAPGATVSVPVEVSAINSVVGETVTFKVIASLGASTVDPNQDDNEVSVSTTLTEEELAYDHVTADMYNAQNAVGAESMLGAGSVFSIGTEDVLTGISIGWGAVDGQMINLQVYKWDAATMTVGDLIVDTDVEQGNETGQITYQIAPRQLTPGDYLAVVYFTGYQLICDMSNDGILYVVSNDIINTQVGLGNPAIRLVFGEGTAMAKDLAVTEIPSPATEGLFADNEPIVVKVTNNGYEESTATLSVTVNGTALDSQEITLGAYASGEYTFSADLSEAGEYTIVASVALEGDENAENNEMQKVVTSMEALDPYTMDFESCADFATSGFNPQWTTVDGDESIVYGFQGITFPMPASGAFGFMAFNPSMTTPSMIGMEGAEGIMPHGGNKIGAAFSASSGLNDDWLISPLLEMPEEDASISLFVKSYTDQYGLEKYNVLVSETDNDPASFSVVKSGEAPVEDWEEVTVDLSEYAGENIYIAIQCVSEDAFIFMVDDITVSKPSGGSVNDNLADATSITLYPNPASETLVINAAGAAINEVSLYSAAGTMVYSSTGINGTEFRHNVSSYVPGIYFAKVATNSGVKTMKFIVK